jgi:hypothetical protein
VRLMAVYPATAAAVAPSVIPAAGGALLAVSLAVWTSRYCSPHHSMPLSSINEGPTTMDDVAGNRTGRFCSPRHRMPFNSRNEGSECVG